jgi:hypothetical protein
MVVEAMRRSGSTTWRWKAAARSAPPRLDQRKPRTPAAIEPPETLDIRASLGSKPASSRYQRTPT